MIVLIGGEKGGTGKTTIATNLAAMRAARGRDVLLLDTDRQGSSTYWRESRDRQGVRPRVACLQAFGQGLLREVVDLAGRYQDIVIDAGGRDSVELQTALRVAERVFIPIQASQFDVWTLARMDELVTLARTLNAGLRAGIILNRAPTNPAVKEIEEAREALAAFQNLQLAVTVIRERIAFRKAAPEGRAVTELQPGDPKAAKEMKNLCREVFDDG